MVDRRTVSCPVPLRFDVFVGRFAAALRPTTAAVLTGGGGVGGGGGAGGGAEGREKKHMVNL